MPPFVRSLTVGLCWFASTLVAAEPSWRFTIAQGNRVSTTVTVQNRCAAPHSFRVTAGQGTSFVEFIDPAERVRVPARGTVTLAIRFSAVGADPGLHTGEIIVQCLDCAREPTCTQDREAFAVEMTVASPEPPTAVQQEGKKCQCTLGPIKNQKVPTAICLGGKFSVGAQYQNVVAGSPEVVEIKAQLETGDGKLISKLESKRVSCAATQTHSVSVTPTAAGSYRIVFSVECAAKSHTVPFDVIDLGKISGADRYFVRKAATTKSAAGEWAVEITPASEAHDRVTWEITPPAKGRADPAKGSGTKATATLTETGKYTVRFSCDKKSVTKQVTVEEIDSAGIAGPSFLCFEPIEARGVCREPERRIPEGTWTLTVTPPQAGLRWEISRYLRTGLERVAEGNGAAAKFAFARPGCYRVSFFSGEGFLVAKDFLVLRLDLDVVVDDDLSTVSAAPVEIPIYTERPQGDVCARLDVKICARFPMRFRVRAEPAVVSLKALGNVNMAEDRDERDRQNAFTGLHSGESCDPDSVSVDYFTLAPVGNGLVEIIARNPRTGETSKKGEIAVTVPPALADLLLVEGNSVRKPLVQNNRVQVMVKAVKDNGGHQSEYFGGRNEPFVRIGKLFDVANTYWSQCGICFAPATIKDLQVGEDFGAAVDRPELQRLRARNATDDGSTGITLNFVHALTGADDDGLTYSESTPGVPDATIIFRNPGTQAQLGNAVAHELLHAIARLATDHAGETACHLGVAVSNSYADGWIRGEQCTTAADMVKPRLKIINQSLPSAKAGTPYRYVFRALADSADLTWTILGAGDAGLTTTIDGVIQGTPETPGKYGLRVSVKKRGTLIEDSARVTLTVER